VGNSSMDSGTPGGLVRPDAKRAYELIRKQITTLELAPGAPINDKHLAEELSMDLLPVQEALQLLAHDKLVVITPPQEHGIYVAHVHRADLDQLSQVRLTQETLSARLAAELATEDDLEALEALRQEQATISAADSHKLFDLDHRFHQAIARAGRNPYLADALEHFFGLSQRLWNLALPGIDFLPAAVAEHLDLIKAIEDHDVDRAAQLMYGHVEDFYNRVRALLTIQVMVNYGTDARSVEVEKDSLLGAAIIATGLPLEQPCAGRGTCHKCKVIAQGALSPLDEKEMEGLTAAERGADYRLACRARVLGDVTVTLAPIVVYSNKIFHASDDYRRKGTPLGLAIDLGSTTVAAFVTTLDTGRVCLGAAALNQQTAFGADVISRMAAALQGPETAQRLSMLALSSIVQAVDALRLSSLIKARIQKVTIVGNCAMHHLLLQYPVDTLSQLPFQPADTAAVRASAGSSIRDLFGDTFPDGSRVMLPPLIGGFVGSDALACLTYYGFDRAPGPMAAIDLGTNGEVMVTDGKRILVASTAAGPAFEGVNISCGTRAVDGAIVGVKADHTDGSFDLTTIGDHPPVGLTGSGLLDLICELRRAGVIERSGRFARDHATFGHRLSSDEKGVRRLLITDKGVDLRGAESLQDAQEIPLYLTQHDIRELQKAKGAIRAATEILMAQVGLEPSDLQRMILTGSFGSQLNVEAVVGLGMIPPVDLAVVEPSANGAGFGAALFLDDEEFIRGEQIAAEAEQVDLDLDADFNVRYIEAMELPGQ
jgi:uncharacterized 2Fe-2S/4Fe-4S cluster protein (DUF4445 family)/DNA-binding GntR family transcriptional regulator